MMERIDYWRGFAGGFLAGVAIGAWIYFSPRKDGEVIDYEHLDRDGSQGLSVHREFAESAAKPS
jgi:hypothetical protein